MGKIISNIFIAVMLFFLSLVFLQPLFASTLICAADNNKTYRYDLPSEAEGRFEENIDWKKGRKAGTSEKLVIKNVRKPEFSDDYIQITDGKYTITYALRCVYE
jgi:hypothetical protein